MTPMETNDDKNELQARARTLIESIQEPEEHLDYAVHLAPYAEGTIDTAGREIVESHIEDCAMCRGELEDLQRHAQAAPRQAPPWRLLALAASLVMVIGVAVAFRRLEPPAAAPAVPPPVMSIRVPAPAPPPQPAYARPEWTQLVERALAEGRLPSAAVSVAAALNDDAVRGSSDRPSAELKPSGVVVDTPRPTLEWPATPGATYVAVVFSGEEEVASSGPLAQPRWTPDRDLPRGRTYVWQVEVSEGESKTLLPSLPTPPPAFHVLGTREHAELEQARAQHPDDRLLLGVLAARYGLTAEARRQLEGLASSPDPRVRRLAESALQDGSPTRTNAAQ